MKLESIVTPSLILNNEICLRNIENMSKKAEAAKVCFRPHFKTHQSRSVGKWFRNYDVNGITVSSVKMASYFADDGWDDITIAFPFNPREWNDIRKLTEKCKINILASGRESAKIISEKVDSRIGVFIETDNGYKRSGIDVFRLEEIVKTAQILKNNNNIHLSGILSHFGNSYSESSAGIQKIWDISVASLLKVKEALLNFGNIKISVGDTPCCSKINDFSGIDEIRPGNFIFYDIMQASKGICNINEIALTVACPVVDLHPERGEIIIYGGGIHLSKEFILNTNGERNYGVICSSSSSGWVDPVSESFVISLSQEHGIVKAPVKFINSLHVGDLVFILPIHSCITAQCFTYYTDINGNMHDHM